MARQQPGVLEIEMERFPPHLPLDGMEIDAVLPFNQSYGTGDSLQVRATNKEGESVWFKISMKDIQRVLKSCDYKLEYGRSSYPKLVEPKQVRDIDYPEDDDER